MNLIEDNYKYREDYITSNVLVDGILARTVSIPKGDIVVGELHKYANISYLIKGKVKIYINGRIEYKEAPAMIVSDNTTRKIVYAIEDVIWTSIHRTDKTNIKDIESDIIIPTSIDDLKIELNKINEELICLG